MSEGRAYDWNENVENPNEGGEGYRLLEPGDYPFTVKTFERAQYPGGGKTPPCKKAVVHIEVDGGPQGRVEIKDDLILHSNFDWKLAAFFKALGFRKSGDGIRMEWLGQMAGRRGRLSIKHREVTEGKHAGKKFNEVDKYLEPGDLPTPAPAPTHAEDSMDWMQPAQPGWSA